MALLHSRGGDVVNGAQTRGARRDEGFTLIELMVVVLIIAVLIAIAIPTFMRTRQAANDRAVQSNVRNAFTAARVYYNEHLTYSAAVGDMLPEEPSLTWTNTPLVRGVTASTIYIATADYPTSLQTVVVGGRSSDGRCFFIRDVMGGATAGTFFTQDITQSASCVAPDPTNDALWSPQWSRR